MARSTLTYVDEWDIENVLRRIFDLAERCVFIAEPSGVDDDLASNDIEWVTGQVYKRKHDHTHIRDYGAYLPGLGVPFKLAEDRIDASRLWVFIRTKTEEPRQGDY